MSGRSSGRSPGIVVTSCPSAEAKAGADGVGSAKTPTWSRCDAGKANSSHLAFCRDVISLFLDLEFCPVGSPDQISGHPVGSETPFLQTGEPIAQQCFDVDTVIHPPSLEFRSRGAQRSLHHRDRAPNIIDHEKLTGCRKTAS